MPGNIELVFEEPRAGDLRRLEERRIGQNVAGAGLFAFDRLKMLVGDPSAAFIYFDYFPVDPNAGGMLPTDLDGLVPPPVGTPNFFKARETRSSKMFSSLSHWPVAFDEISLAMLAMRLLASENLSSAADCVLR